MQQDEVEGLQTDYESSGSDSPPEDVEFSETDPPPPLLCVDDDYQSDIGKVILDLASYPGSANFCSISVSLYTQKVSILSVNGNIMIKKFGMRKLIALHQPVMRGRNLLLKYTLKVLVPMQRLLLCGSFISFFLFKSCIVYQIMLYHFACLKFFKVFFSILGQFSKVLADIAVLIPSLLYQAKCKPQFVKYVVCRKCHCIYYFSECIEGYQRYAQSKLCPFQQFPMHPHERMRRPCGTLLLKSVESASGKTYLYPYLTYCYLGLRISMEKITDAK